jgi:hypothetical protein
MYKIFFLLFICLGALLVLAGYCAVLIDWIQDISADVYKQNFMEALLETSGLGVYTYLGIRFFNRTLGSIR